MNDVSAVLNVTGETRVYIVVGDPIRQVRSTQLYNRLASEKDLDVVFVPLHFAAEHMEAAITALRIFQNIDGIIPTIPHKASFFSAVDELSERARMVGAVNTIRCEADGRWVGDMFDGIGYVKGLTANGYSPEGKSVLLVGAGGAGSAMAFALAEKGVSRLRIFDLYLEKAERVASGVAEHFPGLAVDTGLPHPEGFDFVANATPVGMRDDDPLPVDPDRLASGQLVTEMIMQPSVTPLLIAAKKKGCRIVHGYEALLGQAQANMEFFGFG